MQRVSRRFITWFFLLAIVATFSLRSHAKDLPAHLWLLEDYTYAPATPYVIACERRGEIAGDPALHAAVARNGLEKVRAELARGVPVDLGVVDGALTPLCIAAIYGRADIARVLLAAGANPNHHDARSDQTPLLMAAGAIPTIDGDHLAVVRALLAAGANPRFVRKDGTNILHAAVGAIDVPLVEDWLPLRPEFVVTHEGHRLRPFIGGSIGIAFDGPKRKQTARRGDVERLRLLVDAGVEPGIREGRADPPIISAIKHADEARVKLLLERGALPMNARVERDRALREAVASGTDGMLAALLDAGIPLPRERSTKQDPEFLQLAARSEDDSGTKVKRLIDLGMTPLPDALRRGSAFAAALYSWADGSAVRPLLDAGVDPQAVWDDLNRPILLAARNCVVDALAALLDAGAPVSARDDTTSTPQWTPLMHAAESDTDSFEKVRLLLDHGAPVDEQLPDGRTAIVLAAAAGNMEAVVALVEAGANPNVHDAPSSDARMEMTPLMLAAWRGGSSIVMSRTLGGDAVRALLDAGAEVNATVDDGRTALFFAIETGQVDVCRMLIEHGAALDVTRTNSFGGTTPDRWRENLVETAVRFERVEILELFLAHGAPWQSAEPEPHRDILLAAAQWANPDLLRLLLDAGADPNAGRDHRNETALHRVLMSRIIRPYSSTPPQPAACIRLLLEAGIDPNAANDVGATPLHWIALDLPFTFSRRYEEGLDIARALLEAGADPTLQDAEGRTPLDLARERRGNIDHEISLARDALIELLLQPSHNNLP